jgi:hypothetical protein
MDLQNEIKDLISIAKQWVKIGQSLFGEKCNWGHIKVNAVDTISFYSSDAELFGSERHTAVTLGGIHVAFHETPQLTAAYHLFDAETINIINKKYSALLATENLHELNKQHKDERIADLEKQLEKLKAA